VLTETVYCVVLYVDFVQPCKIHVCKLILNNTRRHKISDVQKKFTILNFTKTCPSLVGESGNVLITKDAQRMGSYKVWNYAEGHDSYYASMLVDLTLPHDDVSHIF